ncbi:hypothetical protein ON010_g17758 [Phytophthora cinnamomi]|nr:hypothetical protein ON010_g17758 [Phytophthora cinnamomi]
MLEQVEAVATNPQEKERYTLQIGELREKQRAVMEDPDAHLNLKRSKRYAPPKGAVKGGATVATVAGQESAASAQPVTTPLTDLAAIPPNVDNLSALAVAVESLSSTSDSSKGSCMAPGSLPLGVQIPAAEISVPASLTTPMHASVSHYASSPSARLSPSNRKVKLAKAGVDAEHRLRILRSKPAISKSSVWQARENGASSSGHGGDAGRALRQREAVLRVQCVSRHGFQSGGDAVRPPLLWMQNHSECPVCKAGISEENVIPVYARGAEAVDPRTQQQMSESGIPHRPRGQRPDAEQLRRRRPYSVRVELPTAVHSNGNGNAMSPTIGFFPALFGVPYQPPPPVTHHPDGSPLTAQEARQQVQQAFLSRFLLVVGSLVILCLITF